MNRKGLVLVSIALLSLCTPGRTSNPEERMAPPDPTLRLAMLSAFGPELEKLRSAADVMEIRVIHGRSASRCRRCASNGDCLSEGREVIVCG